MNIHDFHGVLLFKTERASTDQKVHEAINITRSSSYYQNLIINLELFLLYKKDTFC